MELYLKGDWGDIQEDRCVCLRVNIVYSFSWFSTFALLNIYEYCLIIAMYITEWHFAY